MKLAVGFLAVGLAAAALPAGAADAAGYRYEIFWGGFHAADASLTRGEGDGGYRANLSVHTAGTIGRWFPFLMEAVSDGTLNSPEPRPRQFDVNSRSRSAVTEIQVAFEGGAARTVLDQVRRLRPADDESEPRPEVPAELRAGTLDPLAALVAFGSRVAAGAPKFTLPVFDGRRRYDVVVEARGEKRTTMNRQAVSGLEAAIAITPLAGFKTRERERWEGSKFAILMDPSTQLPLRIQSENFGVATVISAIAPCDSPSCGQSAEMR